MIIIKGSLKPDFSKIYNTKENLKLRFLHRGGREVHREHREEIQGMIRKISCYFSNKPFFLLCALCVPLFPLCVNAFSFCTLLKFELTKSYKINLYNFISKITVLAFVLFAMCTNQFLFAQDKPKDLFDHPVISEETIAQFKKIAGKLQENKIIRAEFKQTKTIKALKRPLLSEGNFLIALGKGLYFETTKPFEQLTVITPEYLIQKDSDGNISKIKSDAHPLLQKSTESFLSIFSGKTESLKEQYQIFILEENEEWQIGLIPKENNESREYIGKIIFKGGKFLSTLTMVEKLGNTTVIEFSSHKADQGELLAEEIKKFELKK